MTGELKEYEVIFRQKMPGQVKENEYTIKVKADNPIDCPDCPFGPMKMGLEEKEG